LAAAIVAALGVIFLPNDYLSVAKVLPASDRPLAGFAQMAALAPLLGLGGLGQDSDGVYGEVLSSWWLHQRLLATRFQFRQRPWRFGAPRARDLTWREYLGEPTLDQAVQSSRDHVRVLRDIKTRAITIEVETRSAELSQAVAHRVLALLGGYLLEQESARGGSKARFAQARLGEAEQAMDQAEAAMKRWLEDGHDNYLTSLDPALRLEGAHLEQALALGRQRLVTLTALHEQALLEEKNDIPSLNVLDEGNLPERKSGPQRGLMVMACFGLVFLGDWLRRSRPALLAALDR
jgi:hypothetical protein